MRYFRAGEIDCVTGVKADKDKVSVVLKDRTDHWRDLGGGLGYVPDGE